MRSRFYCPFDLVSFSLNIFCPIRLVNSFRHFLKSSFGSNLYLVNCSRIYRTSTLKVFASSYVWKSLLWTCCDCILCILLFVGFITFADQHYAPGVALIHLSTCTYDVHYYLIYLIYTTATALNLNMVFVTLAGLFLWEVHSKICFWIRTLKKNI